MRARKPAGEAAKWICANCAGPHRTRECPMTNGSSAPVNQMGLGMMMGMMANPMGMPGMPKMPGMPHMAYPGMPGMPGMPGADGDKKKSKDKRKKGAESSSSAGSGDEASGSAEKAVASDAGSDGAPSEASGAKRRRHRRRSRSKDKKKRQRGPVRVEEVERWLQDNRINEEATVKVRELSPTSQKQLIERPLTGDVQNPSKVIITRVRALKEQAEQSNKASSNPWTAWSSAMMGAAPAAVDKFIKDNDLDDSAVRLLRSLPPAQQAQALQFDLSKYRNPSAKFMDMANKLGSSSRNPFMGMMGMPMPGMMPGMPGMMPGMTGMPMLGMMPGMMPGLMPGMHFPGMPGMPPRR